MRINIVHLGRIKYQDALDIQQKLQYLCEKQAIDDTLLLMEHPSVLTLGANAKPTNIYLDQEQLTGMGIDTYKVNRGGDVTYHGPGQIVGYLIFDLSRYGRDIRKFLFMMEEVFIRLLREEYAIDAHREYSKYTGVWVGQDKITAIGIAVKHWISMHGFAFNVNTDLSHFAWINPCGLSDRGVTSLKTITGKEQDMEKLMQSAESYLCSVFGGEGYRCSIESLIG